MSNPFLAARYHSLVIAKDSVPDDLEVTAWTEDGTIMAVQHKKYPQIQVGRVCKYTKYRATGSVVMTHCRRAILNLAVGCTKVVYRL